MEILVTGATGFIGSHTAEHLKSLGHHVIGVDNYSPYYDRNLKELNRRDLQNQQISIIEMDLRNTEDYKSLDYHFDYIFHFTAQSRISSQCTLKII